MDKGFVIFVCTLAIAAFSTIAMLSWHNAKIKVSCNELKAVAIAASAPEPKCAQ